MLVVISHAVAESTETTVADVKVESAEPAAAAAADDAAATKSEDAGEEAGEDAKKVSVDDFLSLRSTVAFRVADCSCRSSQKPAWVQSLEDTIINPLKEGTEKVAQETKHAFEEAGKKIDESIAKSKEPGGVFAKETYVAMGDKIKQVRPQHHCLPLCQLLVVDEIPLYRLNSGFRGCWL